jgi:hypothetical protein
MAKFIFVGFDSAVEYVHFTPFPFVQLPYMKKYVPPTLAIIRTSVRTKAVSRPA